MCEIWDFGEFLRTLETSTLRFKRLSKAKDYYGLKIVCGIVKENGKYLWISNGDKDDGSDHVEKAFDTLSELTSSVPVEFFGMTPPPSLDFLGGFKMENIKKPSNVLLICGFIFFGVLLAFSLLVPVTESKKPAATSDEDDGSDLSSYVTLGKYKGLKLSSKPAEVSDDDVNALYENFKANYQSYNEDSNNCVDVGDFIHISYRIGDTDTSFNVEGELGTEAIPKEFETAVQGLSEGESAVVDLSKSAGDIYYITVDKIQEYAPFTDEYIESLNLPGVKTVDDVLEQLRAHLEKEAQKTYEEGAKDELIAQIYNSCSFSEIPAEIVEPFKELLKTRLDNAVEAYRLRGEDKSYDDILADTYKKDNISSVDEYLDIYGLQNARTTAICQAIAKRENIAPDIQKSYSLASSDWVNVKDAYSDLNSFLLDNSISVYERAELLEEVRQFLFDNAVPAE